MFNAGGHTEHDTVKKSAGRRTAIPTIGALVDDEIPSNARQGHDASSSCAK